MPHQRRVALLEAEVEKHRHMFCKARREHERCKVRPSFVVCGHTQKARIVPASFVSSSSYFYIIARRRYEKWVVVRLHNAAGPKIAGTVFNCVCRGGCSPE